MTTPPWEELKVRLDQLRMSGLPPLEAPGNATVPPGGEQAGAVPMAGSAAIAAYEATGRVVTRDAVRVSWS